MTLTNLKRRVVERTTNYVISKTPITGSVELKQQGSSSVCGYLILHALEFQDLVGKM